MTLLHPLQSVILNATENLLFAAVKNEVLVFMSSDDGKYSLVGRWVDDVANKKVLNAGPGAKKAKINDGKPQEKAQEGKLHVETAEGSHGVQIRNLTLSPDETKLVLCADSDKSVVVLNIDLQKNVAQSLTCIKRQTFPKRPNSIAILADAQAIVVADKFGDVFEIPLTEESTSKPGEDSQPLLGHVSMLTDVLFCEDSNGRKYLITSDRDEHVKISHYPQTFIVDKWLFGHQEFVASLHIPSWKSSWLFSAGGDSCIFCWDWQQGTKLSSFDYAHLIKPYLTDAHFATARFQNENKDLIECAVPKVTTCRNFPFMAFFVESTTVLVILQVCQNTGNLSLKQIIELRYNIISLSQTSNGFIVTLDNRQSENKYFVQLIDYVKEHDTFELDEQFTESLDNAINQSLTDDTIANVEITEVAPLYGVINLKKHGEQYS
ncbi:related to tRNA (guanine-N(7)-)-methyltransferase subunit TRM82 [Zygosaccharomyces bailii ISA1307]|uniref:ZYBA0S03-12376g1_1 n=1 Tax=Zygosaccharomyces bailii (strain CLIB 213 / ATCC 58445 / CBS 680 / BCRC 21525 / NBRC 1098 / NCYC 1416 / NRRL Y-2227) TaxID=1333698 RepID=A0A8J2T6K2_ZYGB2|nr:ZYBA0S03-12376g1_1 [Zygosaccharomyces bailii CLIB 213]CDH16329.1 related to tRNA (guanine-N(7)-)-methyltransferase subunit TRM82 [Zygosaccharomyces bailii ISA1307]